MKLHERYVDDTNLVGKKCEVGARYENGNIIITQNSINEDEGEPDDKRTMQLLQTIANSIHPSIRMTIDYPSKYPDGKVPMLDVKMWIEEKEGRQQIVYNNNNNNKGLPTASTDHLMTRSH